MDADAISETFASIGTIIRNPIFNHLANRFFKTISYKASTPASPPAPTPALIANIAGGGGVLFSAFNQLKHFLALSLLVTFSLKI
jgi:hypothetical protein